MSRLCSAARLALPGLLALTAFAAPQAASATASLDYRCQYPLHSIGGAKLEIDAYTPEVVFPGQGLEADVSVAATTTPLRIEWLTRHYPNIASLTGTGEIVFTLTDNSGAGPYDMTVPLDIEAATPGADTTPLYATGTTPWLALDQGSTTFTASRVSFNLTARDGEGKPLTYAGPDVDGEYWPDSDGDKTTFDVTCGGPAVGQDGTVSRVIVDNLVIEACYFGGDFCPVPSPPRHVRVGDITPTSAELRWTGNSYAGGYGDAHYGRFGYTVEFAGRTLKTSENKLALPDLSAGTTYTGTIRATYASKTSTPVPFTFTTAGERVDTTPPSMPTEVDFVESDFRPGSVNLRWGPSVDAPGASGLKEYRIRYEGGPTDGVVVPAGTTQKLIAGLGEDSEYYFEISAVDHAGNESDPLVLFIVIPHGDPCWVFANCPQPQPPVGVAVSLVTETSAHLEWTAPNDETVNRYRVQVNSLPPYSVLSPSADLAYLEPGTDYTVKISSISKDDTAPPSDPVTVSFRTVSVDPAPQKVNYDATGTVTVGSLLRGVIPQKGGAGLLIGGTKGKRTVNGNVNLDPSKGRLVGLGFLPVTAKIAFVNYGEGTGVLEGGSLTFSQKVRLKVLEAKLFGAIPLAAGNNCQTKSVSELGLSSNGAPFDEIKGGSLVGKFKISDLNGCGPFNGLVSPLVAGTNNTIALSLTPKAVS